MQVSKAPKKQKYRIHLRRKKSPKTARKRIQLLMDMTTTSKVWLGVSKVLLFMVKSTSRLMNFIPPSWPLSQNHPNQAFVPTLCTSNYNLSSTTETTRSKRGISTKGAPDCLQSTWRMTQHRGANRGWRDRGGGGGNVGSGILGMWGWGLE